MTVRTAYAGTTAAGNVLTSANFTKLPGGWIGHAEATSNQTPITTVTDLTGLSVAVTVGTSRRVKITGYVQTSSSAAGIVTLGINEGATVLNTCVLTIPASAVCTMVAIAVVTPTSGAHTYKLTLAVTAGNTGTNVSATSPAGIIVEDLGPA